MQVRFTRRWQAVVLGVGTCASLAIGVVGVVLAILSPTVFDAPGAIMDPLTWLVFLLVIGLWVVCLAAPYGAWVAFLKRRTDLAMAAISAPVAWSAALVVAAALVPTP